MLELAPGLKELPTPIRKLRLKKKKAKKGFEIIELPFLY